MTTSRFVPFLACLIAISFLLCGPQALAQGRHHFQVRVVPAAHFSPTRALARFDDLFSLSFGFAALPPVDQDGNDAWPCFPNSSNPNAADCSGIAAGGVVTGVPAYTWSLAACNGNTSTSPSCGQIFWFYEDDSGDSTDHLVVQVVAKQGSNYILDTGKIDLGPNSSPSGSIVVIYGDTAFGTLGATGKNNGFCAGSNKVCSDPLAGLATITVTTKVGPSKISSHFDINLQ